MRTNSGLARKHHSSEIRRGTPGPIGILARLVLLYYHLSFFDADDKTLNERNYVICYDAYVLR